MKKGTGGQKATQDITNSSSFPEKDDRSLVFLLINEDLSLDAASEHDLTVIQQALGWTLELGIYVPNLLIGDQKSIFIRQLEKGFAGQCFSFDLNLSSALNPTRAFEFLVTPSHVSDGRVSKLGLAFSCQESGNVNQVNFSAESLSSIVFNSVSMGICITDRQGKFVEVNPEYCRIYGYEREELIGRSFTLVLEPQHHEYMQELHMEFFKNGTEPPSEFEVITKDGRILTIGIFSDKLTTPDGIEYKVTSINDITELKSLEHQVETLSKNLPGIVFRYKFSPDGTEKLLYVSEGIRNYYGLQPEEALKNIDLIWSQIYPEFIPGLKESITRSAQTLQTWEFEWKYSRPDGPDRWHRAMGNPKKQADGAVIWDSIILDITQEKLAREALLESERRFEKLISEGVEMISVLNTHGEYIYNSPSYQTILGYSQDELKGFQAFSLIHPEDVPQLYAEFNQVLDTKKIAAQPYRIRRKDGTYIWMKSIGTNLLDDPLINGIVVNSSNITDLIQVESDLKSSEQQYKYLFENNPGAMMIWELESGRILDVNDRACTMYGYDYAEFLEVNVYKMRPQEEVTRVQEQAKNERWTSTKGTKLFHAISKHFNKSGEILSVEVSAQMIDYHGKRVSLVLLNDVTEKLTLQEELNLSNERYEYVNLATKDAIYDWDVVKNKLYWGKSYARFLGSDMLFEDRGVQNWEELVHPEDRDRVNGILKHDLSDPEKERFKAEYQIRKHNGTYAFVVDRAIIVRDESGNAIRMVGVLSDITQQRLEEFRLKLLESVITNANDAVIITEAAPLSLPGPSIVYVNEAFTRMTGYTEEEVLGKSPRILQGPNTHREELQKLRKAMESWQPCEITTINYRKNGEEFWTNFSISPVADAEGWFTHWISIQREVTAQKIEEQKRDLLTQIIQSFGEERRFNFALDRSLEQLVRFKNLDAGEIWLVNSDKTKLNLVSRYALSDAGSKFFSMVDRKVSFRKGEGLPGKVWQTNEILNFANLFESEEFTRKQAILASGMNAAFGIPLHHNGQVIGVGVFVSEQKNGFLSSFLEVFGSISNVLGAEIYRKKVEDELSQIFDTAQDIICITGFDGKFKKINKGAMYLLGYSEEELLSVSFMDLVHPDDWHETENVLDHLCKGQNFMHFFNRLISKDGEIIWLDWNSTVVLEEELIYSVAKDITEEKELQKLLDSANKMARIGFWEVDIATGMQYWSSVTKEIHEVEDTYVANLERGIEFYAPEAKPIISECFNRCLETGQSYDLELQLITAKGKKIWIRTQAQAEFLDGVCQRIYGSIQDISDLKNAQIDLKEALYEKDQILESIGDGFFSLDMDWIVTYWNNAAERLFKRSKEQAIGKNIRELFPIEIALNSLSKYNEAMDQNSSLVYEEFFSELGTWFEISVFPSFIGVSVYFKDITLRKTTEELIRQSNERFEKVAEATHEAIWDWEVTQNKVYWGPGYKILFGLDPDQGEISFETWATHVHPDDFEPTRSKINHALENKNIAKFQNEYRFKRADGTFANVIDRAVVIRTKTGQAKRLVGAMQDITDQKTFESSLKSLNEKLEGRARELAASNAELEQFAYVASHDLQEPLRMVTSFLTQLEMKYGNQLDDRAKKYIDFAVDGAKRMRQIILDLLEFSRVGRIEEEPEVISLDVLINEVRRLQTNLIKNKNARIINSDLPVIRGFRTPLIQIFQNLISNAIKYSKEGVDPEVKISCRELPGYWKFAVEDNGIGMEAGSFDKIFVIFQRLHTRDQFAGTGIGLAIVKKIVENLGGKIWVESELGVGSTFYFTLKK